MIDEVSIETISQEITNDFLSQFLIDSIAPFMNN